MAKNAAPTREIVLPDWGPLDIYKDGVFVGTVPDGERIIAECVVRLGEAVRAMRAERSAA